jgi:hypothetical protein
MYIKVGFKFWQSGEMKCNKLKRCVVAISEVPECTCSHVIGRIVLYPHGKEGSRHFADLGLGLPKQELQRVMKPLAEAASLMPPMAFRADPFVLATTLGRYFPYLLQVAS